MCESWKSLRNKSHLCRFAEYIFFRQSVRCIAHTLTRHEKSVVSLCSIIHIHGIFIRESQRLFTQYIRTVIQRHNRVASGNFVFNQGTDDSVSATSGDIVYLPSNVSYVSDWVGSARGSYITLHFVLDEFYVKFPSYICIAKHDKDGLFLKAFYRMLTIWQQGKPGYELETLAQFYNFIHILYLDYMSVQLKEKHSKIYKGILYLENNYTDDVSISELAEMCYLSESTFRRLFLDYKKMPPITYRNYLRMKKAYTLIKTGEYTVTEAASAVNIPDLCYFNRLFKKYFGISLSKIM